MAVIPVKPLSEIIDGDIERFRKLLPYYRDTLLVDLCACLGDTAGVIQESWVQPIYRTKDGRFISQEQAYLLLDNARLLLERNPEPARPQLTQTTVSAQTHPAYSNRPRNLDDLYELARTHGLDAGITGGDPEAHYFRQGEEIISNREAELALKQEIDVERAANR